MSIARLATRLRAFIALLTAVSACASPTPPGSSTVSPAPVLPAHGATLSFYEQPITLTATKPVATGGVTVDSTFEIAADATFATTIAIKAAQPSGERLAATLDRLNAAHDYFWRVHTKAPDNPELVS